MLPPLFIFCYNAKPPRELASMPYVMMHQGPIKVEDLKGLHAEYGKDHHLVCINDDSLNQLRDLSKEEERQMAGLFIEGSRHDNISVIVVVHDLFLGKDKLLALFQKNCTHTILFNFLR